MNIEIIKPSGWVHHTLITLLYFEVCIIFYILSSDLDMLYYFITSLLCVSISIRVIKYSFEHGGLAFSKACLHNHPLRKKKTMKKWCDQGWQLMIHFTMAILEYYILTEETWWHDTISMWHLDTSSGICNYTKHRTIVKIFYLIQLAIWIYTAFSCTYLEEIRKDYVVMMTHHIVTIALVAGSYTGGYLPIGTTILFLHDLSDVPLDMLKMVNYAKLEGKQGYFATEITFVLLLVEWFYFRVYLFPTKLVYSAMFESNNVHAVYLQHFIAQPCLCKYFK